MNALVGSKIDTFVLDGEVVFAERCLVEGSDVFWPFFFFFVYRSMPINYARLPRR